MIKPIVSKKYVEVRTAKSRQMKPGGCKTVGLRKTGWKSSRRHIREMSNGVRERKAQQPTGGRSQKISTKNTVLKKPPENC